MKNKKNLFGRSLILIIIFSVCNIQNVSAGLVNPDYTETIPAGMIFVLGHDMKVGDEVVIEYEVISGGNLDVYFYIKNSDDIKVVDNGLVAGYGMYTFVAPYEDYFRIVFSNSMSIITSKVIEINLDVTLAEKTITVTSPTSGYYASIGYNTITWDSTGDIENVYISLYKDGYFVEQITSGAIINDGNYSWYISDNEYEDGEDYVIKIKDSTWSDAIYGLSDFFIMDFISETITFISARDIEISSNNDWGYTTYTITWEYTGDIKYVNIDLYRNGAFIETIENNLYNDGIHTWAVRRSDNYIVSNGYQYRISDYNDLSINDWSDYFTITTSDYIRPFYELPYIIIGVVSISVIGIIIRKKRSSRKEIVNERKNVARGSIKKYCSSCGSESNVEATFCDSCGNKY